MFEEIVSKEEEKFNELEKKVFKFVCFFGCLILKLMLESYDRKLMKTRDSKKYRHKGLRGNTIKTIMGEVEYKRTMYEVEEKGITKTVYLLDEKLRIASEGKVSANLVEKVVEIVPKTDSYRKAQEVLEETTNCVLSFEAIRNIIIKVGDKITKREKEEVKLYDKKQLISGLKEITVLFEEADGIWINLQGKDRKEQLEKNEKRSKKEGKEFNAKMKVKTELKLLAMYEGWKAGDKRHSLVDKEYIAGIMKPKEMSKIRDAKVYQKYKEEKIKLRVTNGDGAKWTKKITAKGGIYQKDWFHVEQEITRDVPKEYRGIIRELAKKKDYEKIKEAIERLRYEVSGEEKAMKKLNALESYLSQDLERYTELVEVPEAPEGIEYRTMGTQESQIFSKLKNRFCSGRKAFGKHGANALAKVCVLSEKFSLEDIEEPIPIDTSVEDWIKEIEENVKKNMTRKDAWLTSNKRKEEIKAEHESHIEHGWLKDVMEMKKISELSFI